MEVRQRRYSKEEIARRGQELYESGIRQRVEAENKNRIVAIDIETGAFEVSDEILTATERLFDRIPEAQPWIVRIGHKAVHRFGARKEVIDKVSSDIDSHLLSSVANVAHLRESIAQHKSGQVFERDIIED